MRFPEDPNRGPGRSVMNIHSAASRRVKGLRMKTRSLYAVPLIAWALACAGCQREGLHPVSGMVLYKGEPAAGAVVYFHRDGGAGSDAEAIPMGTVAADGSFWITSGDDYGVPAGSYKVLIEWLDQPTTSKGGAVKPAGPENGGRNVARAAWKPATSRVRPPDRLKGRYLDISHPLVKAEVKPETNTLAPFELTD